MSFSATLAEFPAIVSTSSTEMQPVQKQSRHESPIQQFFLWYRDISEPGVCGFTREPNCTFVPLPKLQDLFLDHERTTRLLQSSFGSNRQLPVDARNISGGYERIFAILLLIGRGAMVGSFIQSGIGDSRLPFDALPKDIPVSANDPDFFATFYRCQWQFCAHVFEQSYNRSRLREKTVLPITSIKEIRSGPNVDVVRITIHPAYDRLQSNATEPVQHQVYILKRYSTVEAERYFESELDAFRAIKLGDTGGSSLVGFYGTFEQQGLYNVLTEYADQGTLLDYFQKAPPVRPEDIKNFWRKLLDLVKSLDAIHKSPPSNARGPLVLQGSHGSINPANILVMDSTSGSRFDVHFKLDLGIDHYINSTAIQGGHTASLSRTSRAYEAPECFRDGVGFPDAVQPEADIWSFACLMSDAVTWVVRGFDGLEEYRVRRNEELKQLGALVDEYCFHDGEMRLQCIDEWHSELLGFKRPTDLCSEPMTQLLRDMLTEPDERPTAKQVLAKCRRLLIGTTAGTVPGGTSHRGGQPWPVRTTSSETGTGSTTSSRTRRGPVGPITPPDTPFSVAPSRSFPVPPLGVSSQNLDQSPGLMPSRLQQGSLDVARKQQRETLTTNPSSYARSGSSRSTLLATTPTSPMTSRSGSWRTHDSVASHDAVTGLQNMKIYSLGSALEPRRQHSTHSAITNISGGDRHDRPSPPEAVEGSPRPSSTLIRAESDTLPLDDQSSISLVSEGPNRRPSDAPEYSPPMLEDAEMIPNPLILPARTGSRPNPKAAPFLSVPRLHRWRQDMREKSSSITIDTRERVHLLPADKRDHIFLIDDASSMQSLWLDVTFLFNDFSYFIKSLPGPDGIGLWFTISLERKQSKATTDLSKLLEKRGKSMETAGPSTSNMESRLRAILGEYVASLENERAPPGRSKHSPFVKKPAPVRPLSLHVYTDGIWQPVCEAENPIREIDKKLEELHLPKTQVAISFVQFGQDEVATRRLQRIQKQFKIVDVEPFKDGNVWKMLNGAISRDYKEPRYLAADSTTLSVVSELAGSPVQTSRETGSRNSSYR